MKLIKKILSNFPILKFWLSDMKAFLIFFKSRKKIGQLQGKKINDYLKKTFKRKMKYDLNLENPKTFNEKLNWLKVNYKNPLMSNYTDKYLVREYIKNKGFENILVPLLDKGDKFKNINWDKLPEKFVLKTNHDSGGVWIINDKKKANLTKLRRTIDSNLLRTYGIVQVELQYKKIKPLVIVEQILEDDNFKDYKIFCFNGEPRYIQVDFDRFKNHTMTFYDISWNNQKFSILYPVSSLECPKPERLSEMLNIAKILSKDFPFMRCDMYSIGDKIYFGEITFFPSAGFEKFSDIKWDKKFGKLLKLPK